MNSFEVVESIGVITIIGLQAWSFWKTRSRIELLKGIFPPVAQFAITKLYLTIEETKEHPRVILENISTLKKIDTEEEFDNESYLSYAQYKDELIAIDVLETTSSNEVSRKIVYSLNTYLIRNRGVASDFHLMKDVVERNCDAVEDDVRQSLSVPLYLGLLGTFIGIIFGLLQITNVGASSNEGALNNAIELLLNGVKIAMFASLSGLALTVLNSAISLKGAKAQVEDNKNDFYTFIQTDLLPLLNQNINSTLYSLQTNLFKFNDDFKVSINKLDKVMGRNYDALLAQDRILERLETMEITDIVKGNVKVLKELNTSVEKFAMFNSYIGHVNELVDNTRVFTEKLDKVVGRTEELGAIGKSLIATFEENRSLQEFLQSHYSSLDQSRQLIGRSVVEVGNTLGESLDQLKSFTQERISEVQKITLREIDLIENQYPEKWKKLDSLSFLETVSKNIADMKMSQAAQMGTLNSGIKDMNEKLKVAVGELCEIRENSAVKESNSWEKRIKGSIKKIFGKVHEKAN